MSNISTQEFRVCLLGAGNISSEHADTLCWLPNTKITGVCDLDRDRANELASKYLIPDVYVSIDEMLEKSKPDVVHILLPPGEHVKYAIQCLRAGSHVFVEKPIGVTTSECNDLMDVARISRLFVGVNHSMLYAPVVQRLIDYIHGRRLGRIVHVNIALSMPPSNFLNINPRSFFIQAPQNPLLEWAVHPLSVVNHLLGKVKQARTLVSGPYDTDKWKNFYTIWQASLECYRGTAQLLMSAGHGFNYLWMDVLGEDAFAHIDISNDSIIISEYMHYRPAVARLSNACNKSFSLLGSATKNMKNYILTGLGRSVAANGMRNSIHAFYDALLNGVAPPEGPAQGAAVVEYCERIFESAFPEIQKEGSHVKER